MVNIFSQIYTKLLTIGVNISLSYNQQNKLTQNTITVVEENNSEHSGTLDTRDEESKLVYLLDVFTIGDTKDNDNREIAIKIDAIMGDHFGFKRTSNKIVPNGVDPTVTRRQIRYEGIINNSTYRIRR